MSRFSLLLYRSRNLGDMIQTFALSRLLPKAKGVFRHRLRTVSPDRFLVWNGYLDKDAPPATGVKCLFAGVSGPHFRQTEYLRLMAQSRFPIGARDPFTLNLVQSAGLSASLIGCATLTFSTYPGPQSHCCSDQGLVAFRRPAHRVNPPYVNPHCLRDHS